MKLRWMPCLLVSSLFAAGCGEAPEPVDASPSSSSAPGAIRRAGLELLPDPGWREEEPENSMRAAQWVLPAAEGAAPGTLVLFYFGAGGGGSAEDNIQRWCSQIVQPDGNPSSAVAERDVLRRSGLTVHTVAVGGRFVAETTPGSGERLDLADWQLRGAVVEGPGGPWFFKLLGPAPTVARWQRSFDDLIASLRP